MTHPLLNCFPCGPIGGGGRSKEPVDGEIIPVYGKTTVFSLPHACLAAGLFDEVSKKDAVNWFILSELAQKKWQGSVDCFWADVNKLNVSPESVEQRAHSHRGAIIGWMSADSKATGGARSCFGICPDLELTAAILSCRVGDIFISERNPDYSWDVLFSKAYECDEDIGPAPALKEAPWNQYKWKIGKDA